MSITQIINNFYKKKLNFLPSIDFKKFKILNFNPVLFLSFIVFFSILFFTISNIINKKNKETKNSLTEVVKSTGFSNLTNYFISKINSPYNEVEYVITEFSID